MFEIKCLNCGEAITFKDGVNNESQIKINGAVESLYGADVFVECQCGNEIVIEKPY